MKKRLTNNIGLKIISLLIAFSIWLVVVNIDDPVISYTYSGIPVDIINGQSLTSQGKIYDVLNGTDEISVTITGKRTVVESIGKENITAVADVENITSMDKVEIVVHTNKNNDLLDNIKADTAFVELAIENLNEVHMPISIAVNGAPLDGYVVGDVTTNQNTVRISGPESVIASIARAEAEVNVANRTSDITTTSDIKLYDAQDNLVDMNHLTMNIKTLNISASVLASKAVEVIYSYAGTPKPGYTVTGDLTSDRMAVNICGRPGIIENVNNIVIPAGAIDVEGADENVVVVIDIKKYLPDGVSFADKGFDGMTSVIVPIAQTTTRSFNISLSDIELVNIPSGYEAEIVNAGGDSYSDNSTASIRLATEAVSDRYAGVNASSFSGRVDIQKSLDANGITIAPGTYHIPIDFICPRGIMVNDDYYVSVKLTEKQ